MAETIVALASGVGRAGVAVIRLSGPSVRFGLETIAGSVPPPRRAALRRLKDPEGGEVLDEALVLFFPGPASFTGEDVAELQVHGGRAIISGVIAAIAGLPGFRLAERGEFTRRAVANGRMDLTSAEGIASLVEAETGSQRRQALRQAGGALERAATAWRQRLAGLLALMEAEIDFPDEDDVPALFQSVRSGAEVLLAEIEAALRGARSGERLREGAVMVIAGPPNAGKSTLLNALARRDVAIVSPVAGTTRDTLEVHLDLGGYPVTLIDTAGLRDTVDVVEAIGVERARASLDRADLVIWLEAGDARADPPDLPVPLLRVFTKQDDGQAALPQTLPVGFELGLSARSGAGMPALLERLEQAARTALESGETALVTRERHRRELEIVKAHLATVQAADETTLVEFVAEDLRLAVRAIGRLTGRVDIDEIYDVIFREFCIGK
ncbi:tRNA uridine-5-carboxymethylaminomethyl(34) synthesis GTPase MnmE [Labrys sp. ZIDIC5]|uniref:tRNA uridine-5-carboxymethylaminomethyl(34) synthesis GTPase MnmE n=1 Tax=Labrys sedimenti TaxID=3106036 RepID=UPI002ACAD11D|nr:tRNA uridine-5-carboxymethylaminomethyl(34) synthesis GTPase MnmE [Labrys sp. ZIDIC5]MDZ5451644.1 tRNA uridine-5-carboxymethylaminomethyl(34) synthesis GTPase MnmE [Labrys sp. ZIDIC5]